MFEPTYPITTQRLTLRPFATDDLHDLHAYESHPDVTRYLMWDVRDLDTTRAFLDKKITRTALHAEGDAIDLAITVTETGQLAGNCLLIWTSQNNRTAEIGYVLHPDHHGHGYAAEAARPLIAYAFQTLGLHRVIGRIDARNTASARVLEKLGMSREAHFTENELVKGEWADEAVYAILEREWKP